MSSGWVWLADAVVTLHLLWICFLVAGALVGRRVGWVRWLHLASLGFAILLTARGWICPLTHLEVWLRRRGGTPGYAGTFIGQYAERLVYLEVPRSVVLGGAVLVAAVSVVAYGWPQSRERR